MSRARARGIGGERLAPLGPLSRRTLARFELTAGLPAAASILHRHLGLWRAARVLLALAARRHVDPLAGVPRTDWPALQEDLTRWQLRTVVHVDDVARDVLGLGDDARMALLADLVSEIGARFVEANIPVPDARTWELTSEPDRARFVAGLGARLVNARVANVAVSDRTLSLDVTACRFVELCRAAGRPHLAPLFCEADSKYFDSDRSVLVLRRSGTLARGAERCDFRFRYRD